MYTLKSIVRRGMTLGAGVALVAASFVPLAAPAFADTLNPLTKRSLTLSSSSPGWSYTDGSGNTTYAPPNSGANGKKSGNTFEFNVSTDTSGAGDKIKAMSFQYCTTSAGLCTAPGDDVVHGTDTTSTSDMRAVFPSPEEVGSSDFATVVNSGNGSVKAVPGFTNPLNPSDVTGVYAAKNLTSNFVVYWNNAGTWTQSTGWNMAVSNVEDGSSPTGMNNYLTLWNSTGLGVPFDATIKVVFFGTANNYLTNPGSGAFFVKINTYKAYTGGTAYVSPTPGPEVLAVAPTVITGDVIDGGVTVANVMNQSIQITTKVLETMEFSVGTVDPNTLNTDRGVDPMSEYEAAYSATPPVTQMKHGICDPILTAPVLGQPANVLQLGNQSAESSLETAHTYSTHSYWRLSSNSSAGATVYYSGHTLSNTSGDQITPIGATADAPHAGSEQFGLAIAPASNTAGADEVGGVRQWTTSYAQEATYENGDDNGKTSIHTTSLTADGTTGNASWHAPRLFPLVPTANYGGGTGVIDGSPTTTFAFDPTSDTIPVALATENSQVVDCVTAKMRYMANIAATTPAGIYTTKVNYIAAPQY